MIALREDTGGYLWSSPLAGIPAGQCDGALPAVSGQQLVVTTTAINSFDAITGAAQWSTTPLDGGQLSLPALANGLVYVLALQGQTIYAYSAADGILAWSRNLQGPIGAPTVAGGLAYAIGAAGLQVFDATYGTPLATIPGTFFGEPVVSNGSVVVGCSYPGIGASTCVFRPAS